MLLWQLDNVHSNSYPNTHLLFLTVCELGEGWLILAGLGLQMAVLHPPARIIRPAPVCSWQWQWQRFKRASGSIQDLLKPSYSVGQRKSHGWAQSQEIGVPSPTVDDTIKVYSKGYRIREGQGVRTIDVTYHRGVSTKQSFCNLLLLVGFSSSDSDFRKG